MKNKYLSFDNARDLAISLNLKSKKSWIIYCKSVDRTDIPFNPDRSYKNVGWINWYHFLGTKNFLSFYDAKTEVHKLNLKSIKEWKVYCKSCKKSDNIPAFPEITYKNKGWENWGDWLGTYTISQVNKKYLSFNEARTFAQTLNLKTQKEWNEYCKCGKKPNEIPAYPRDMYKKEWKSMGEWLGTKKVHKKEI